MSDEISDDIKQSALQPAEATVDGVTIKARTIDEKIKADQYTNAKASARTPNFGLRIARMSPPGAV